MNILVEIMNILFKFINIVRNFESFVELFIRNYKHKDKDIQTIFWGIPNIIFIISYEMFIV